MPQRKPFKRLIARLTSFALMCELEKWVPGAATGHKMQLVTMKGMFTCTLRIGYGRVSTVVEAGNPAPSSISTHKGRGRRGGSGRRNSLLRSGAVPRATKYRVGRSEKTSRRELRRDYWLFKLNLWSVEKEIERRAAERAGSESRSSRKSRPRQRRRKKEEAAPVMAEPIPEYGSDAYHRWIADKEWKARRALMSDSD